MEARLDWLARSTRELLDIAEQLKAAGAGLRSLADPCAAATSPVGRMVLTVFAGIAEFEHKLIHQRTSNGRVRLPGLVRLEGHLYRMLSIAPPRFAGGLRSSAGADGRPVAAVTSAPEPLKNAIPNLIWGTKMSVDKINEPRLPLWCLDEGMWFSLADHPGADRPEYAGFLAQELTVIEGHGIREFQTYWTIDLSDGGMDEERQITFVLKDRRSRIYWVVLPDREREVRFWIDDEEEGED